jgi:hypothetical protein
MKLAAAIHEFVQYKRSLGLVTCSPKTARI